MEASMTRAVPAAHRVDVLRITAVAATVVLIALLNFVPTSTNDLWLQAKIGQMIVETGEIPRTVLFPFTWVRDNSFNAHEWLPSIIFHLLDRSLGHDGLLFAQGLLGLIQFSLCLVLARRLSGSLAVGLLLAAMAMVVANYRYYLRPEIFALLLLMALLQVLSLYRMRGDWRVLAWSAPIAILWANAHGSFIVGPVIAGIFAFGEGAEAARHATGQPLSARVRTMARGAAPYALTGAAMLVASVLNPLGLELLRFALTLSASEVTKTFIDEWTPTLSHHFMVRPAFTIFICALVMTLAVAVTFRRRMTVTDALLLLAFAFLALQRNRFIVLFGFVALVVCARLIGPWSQRPGRERTLLLAATGIAGVGVALVLSFGNASGAYPYMASSTNFTEPMADRLSRPELKGNVFNSYELGAELIYRAYPRLKPSLDSRIDSYGDTYFMLQQELFINERLLKEFVRDYDVRYMLLLWRDFERLKKLKTLQVDWRVNYADHKAVLLERIGGGK
jgi:hypothetical protein